MIEQGREETMQDNLDAIAHLTTAKASDRGSVATLTTNNTELATQLEAAQAHIAQVKDEIANLKTRSTWLARSTTYQDDEQLQLLLVSWI
jgi:anti-sigma-K factor RskA